MAAPRSNLPRPAASDQNAQTTTPSNKVLTNAMQTNQTTFKATHPPKNCFIQNYAYNNPGLRAPR